MRKSILHLFILSLLLAITSSVSAIELHIPPRPDGYICDYAKMFKDDDMKLLKASMDLQTIKGVPPIYILTVPGEYLSQLDTFSKLVARSWGICDTDRSSLLVITAGKDPEAYFTTSMYNADIDKVTTDYISAYQFQYYFLGATSPSIAVSKFLDDVGDGMYDKNTLSNNSEYKNFMKTYNASIPFTQLLAINEPPHVMKYFIGLVVLVGLIVMIVMLVTRWRKKQTQKTNIPQSTSPYREQRGVKKVKGATDHKRTLPGDTKMGPDNPEHPDYGKGKGKKKAKIAALTGAALAAALAAEALANTGDDDDDDDSSSDYSSDDSSSDYSSDSSDYSSSSDDYSSGSDNSSSSDYSSSDYSSSSDD